MIVTLYFVVSGANYFIPTLLTLLLIGREGELGTVESVTAVFTAVLMYIIGRKGASINKMYLFATLAYFVASLVLNISYTIPAVLLYILVTSMILSVVWNLIYTNSMEIMDHEQAINPGSNQYALVLDNEIYFDAGRLLGMALLFGIYMITSQEIALQVTPLILSVLLLLILIPLTKNVAYIQSTKTSERNRALTQ